LICRRVNFVMCRGVELDSDQVRRWYESRACEIEQLSGQVDGALELVKLAIDKSVEVCLNCIHYSQLFSSSVLINGTVLLQMPVFTDCISGEGLAIGSVCLSVYLIVYSLSCEPTDNFSM